MATSAVLASCGKQNGAGLLQLDGITVEFGATRALNNVSFNVSAGEVVGLMGANGAGKSTLAKVIVGEIPHGSYRGTVMCSGVPAAFADARDAHEAGVALVHQEGAVVPQLTIGENVMLTIEPSRFGVIDWKALYDRADAAMRRLGLDIDTRRPLAGQGGVALMEQVEIARAIASGSRVFVFDESTSALGADEIGLLLERMRELAAQGAGIIFISHRTDEILKVCDRVVILRDGRVALEAPRAQLDQVGIVRAMLGNALAEPQHVAHDERSDRGEAAVRLRAWNRARTPESPRDVGPIDIELAAGEIVAVYGPLGAGKTELVESLYGFMPELTSGSVELGGADFSPRNPRDSIARGIAYVSAERQKDGLIPNLSVLENMMLGWHRGAPRKGSVVNHEKSKELCRSFIRDLAIRTQGPDQPISSLSGGNQQKVLLARALINEPRLVLLDEPTRGIDLGAKQDVYRLIRNVASRGTAVLYATMEEDEALELSDRILVLRDGKKVTLVNTRDTNRHELLALAGGTAIKTTVEQQ
ncbi:MULTISPECIES: sugar ABC transporter ATP-binding protein [unclassified Rhizobium]|uniref:sugar ABC transporter ATP-binding protein n=1 Tax=unclassified Rhizobium TaxID=2613769 RepID=UPI00380DF663